MEERQARNVALSNLPEDMEFLKKKVTALMEHTGLQDDDDDIEEAAGKEAEVPLNKEEEGSGAEEEA